MIIGVLSHTQKPTDRPRRWISKNAKACLLRRLLAVEIRRDLIQMKDPRFGGGAPIEAATDPRVRRAYEHHIEPRIERLTWQNSPWLAYLDNY